MNLDVARMWLIARREWSQKIRQRPFVIATAVQIVVVLALILAPPVISKVFGDDSDSSANTVVVLNESDRTGVADSLDAWVNGAGLDGQVRYEAGEKGADPVKLLKGDADGVLTVSTADNGALAFSYMNDDGDQDQTAMLTQAAVGDLALQDNLVRLGVDAEQARQVRAVPQMAIAGTGSGSAVDDTEQGFRYGVAYVSALVMYMAVMVYGLWVAQGVVEEKSSRIMEIMINAARPTELMFGKVIGIGLAGLTQLVPVLLIGGIGLLSQARLADALGVEGGSFTGIDFGALSVKLVSFFLIYFLLGFLLYAALYAGVGSLVSRQEDVSTATTPMTFAVVIGFFAALYTLGSPDSMVAKVVAIFPLTSPMSMVPRVVLGDPAPWEIGLSIALLALTGYLAVMLAARIYRMGVLMYGQRPSLKVIFQRDTISAAR
jgi:ABC-2 type transport system permease protein